MKKKIKKLSKWHSKIIMVVLCILSVGTHLTSTSNCTPVML